MLDAVRMTNHRCLATAVAFLGACGATETTPPAPTATQNVESTSKQVPPKVATPAKPTPSKVPPAKESKESKEVDAHAQPEEWLQPSPVDEVLKLAFGKAWPDLPQLSKDGNTVAFHAGVPYGDSGMSSYVLSFISLEPRAKLGRYIVIDDEATREIADAHAAGRKPKLDMAEVTSSATRVVEHLRGGGYSKFEGMVDEIDVPDLAEVGPYKVQTSQDENGILTLAIHERGKQIGTAKIEPRPGGVDATCVWRPVPEAAWFDTKRRRLLVQVGWRDAAHDCTAPLELYRLFASR